MSKKKDKKIEYFNPMTAEQLIYNKDPGKELLNEERKKQLLSFLIVIGFYNGLLDYADRMSEPNNLKLYHKSPEFWEGYKSANKRWLDWAKKYCPDYPPKMRKPTAAEKKKFKNIEDLEDGTEFEWPLVGIIDYRDDKIPVYDDDACQCYFCQLPDGRQISGGGWNPDPEDEFCFEYDNAKDKILF